MKVDDTLRNIIENENQQAFSSMIKSEFDFRGFKLLLVANQDILHVKNGQMILTLTINLLSRMSPLIKSIDILLPHDVQIYPKIGSIFHDVNSIKEWIEKFSASVVDFSPQMKLVESLNHNHDIVFSVGHTEISHDNKISVFSDGWLVYITDGSNNFPKTSSNNPIGAYVATCLGVAEVFKRVALTINSNLPVKFIKNLIFSTLEFKDTGPFENPELPKEIDIKNVSVIGVGSGGSALIYALSSLESLRGSLLLVDPDEINDRNLQRYIFAVPEHIGKKKVTRAKEILNGHNDLRITSKPISYQEAISEVANNHNDLVVSTVHTAQARQMIAWDLPRIVLDAAVNEMGYCVIHRLDILNGPCLHCIYPPQVDVENTALSDLLGVSESELKIAKTNNNCFSEMQIQKIKEARERFPERNISIPAPYERYSDWLQRGCGLMDLSNIRIVPVPFLTTLAGVLLAGEILKERLLPAFVLKNRFSYNILGVPSSRFRYERFKKDDCGFCGNEQVINRHKKKFGLT